MILAGKQAQHVLAGRKTQARILIREPRLTRRRRKVEGAWQPHGPEYLTQPFRPKVDMRIPVSVLRRVEGHADLVAVPECVVIVRDAEHQLLSAITFPDVLAEGHRTTDEFKAWWVRAYDAHWVARRETTIADDGVEEYEALADDQLAARFDQRWADKAVWAIRFVLEREQPVRYLASEGAGDDRNYTASPGRAIDEPAAVDDRTLQQFAREAQAGMLLRRDEVDQGLLSERADLGRRLLNARSLARERGVDVTSDLRVIEQRIEKIEEKIRGQHPRAA